MNIAAIITILRKYAWLAPWAIIAALGLWLTLERANHRADKAALAACEARTAALIADTKAATARAQAEDTAHAAAIEREQAAITEEIRNDFQDKLALALGRADDYARRNAVLLRDAAQAGADQGSGGAAYLPALADAPGGADGATDLAVLPVADLHACATAVTVAGAWQDWWRGMAAVER
jgi:hypothetical protein